MLQKAASRAPMVRTMAANLARATLGRRASSTRAPVTAKRVGSRWLSPVRVRSTAAQTRYLPVSRLRANTPRNTRASDRLTENENSPARVEAMLPP